MGAKRPLNRVRKCDGQTNRLTEEEKGEQFPASWGMGWRGEPCVLLWLWNVGQLGAFGVAHYVRKYCAASKDSPKFPKCAYK